MNKFKSAQDILTRSHTQSTSISTAIPLWELSKQATRLHLQLQKKHQHFLCDLMVNFQSATFIRVSDSQQAPCCLRVFLFHLKCLFIMCTTSCFARKYNFSRQRQKEDNCIQLFFKVVDVVFRTRLFLSPCGKQLNFWMRLKKSSNNFKWLVF